MQRMANSTPRKSTRSSSRHASSRTCSRTPARSSSSSQTPCVIIASTFAFIAHPFPALSHLSLARETCSPTHLHVHHSLDLQTFHLPEPSTRSNPSTRNYSKSHRRLYINTRKTVRPLKPTNAPHARAPLLRNRGRGVRGRALSLHGWQGRVYHQVGTRGRASEAYVL